MAKVRVLPPQVLAAKLRGDTEALSAMGTTGNRKRARLRAVAVAAAQSDARISTLEAGAITPSQPKKRVQKKSKSSTSTQPVVISQTTEDDARFDAIWASIEEHLIRKDAHAHHMRNLAGVSHE